MSAKMNADGSCTAKFRKEDCASCPYVGKCGFKGQKEQDSLKVSPKAKERAQHIRDRGTEGFKELSDFRNSVETIPSILKNKFHANIDRGMSLAEKKLSLGFMYIALNATKFLQFATRRMMSAPGQ